MLITVLDGRDGAVDDVAKFGSGVELVVSKSVILRDGDEGADCERSSFDQSSKK